MEPLSTKDGLLVATGKSLGARSHQEDNLDAVRLTPPDGEPDALLLALADGMGGHAGGATASRVAVDNFRGAATLGQGPIPDRLFDGLRAANEAIRDAVAARQGPAGMGCTLVGVHVDAQRVRWISVGDSLLWLWSPAGGLRRLNADHSMSPIIDRMVSQGVLSEADAAADPQRHALRSALTGDDITLIDEGERAWRADEVLIAASDGLLTLTNEHISRICAGASKDPDGLVKTLLAAVDAARDPEQDNTSVIVITHGVASEPPATTYALEEAQGESGSNRTPRAAIAAVVLALAVIAAVGAVLLIGGGAVVQWPPPGAHDDRPAPAADGASRRPPVADSRAGGAD